MADQINKNICVVGAGYWGQNHIRNIRSIKCTKRHC